MVSPSMTRVTRPVWRNVNGGIQLAPNSDGASVAVRLAVADGGESLGMVVKIGVREIVGAGVRWLSGWEGSSHL
jgi:hypothetical protein